MYNYEYEEPMLMFLRPLKYLHQQNPNLLAALLQDYDDFDFDLTYEILSLTLFQIFDDYEELYDEENDMEVIVLAHSVWNRFLALSREWSSLEKMRFELSYQRLQDMIDFFIDQAGYSVARSEYHFSGNSVSVRLWLSPDCFDLSALSNCLVDVLIYVQQENSFLEHLISEAQKAQSSTSEIQEQEVA